MKRLLGLPIQAWLVGTIVTVILAAGFLILSQTLTVHAQSEVNPSLDCLRCHTRVLEGHDKLGSGSEVCLTCHNNTYMGILRLLDGTQLSPADLPQLCGQCHLANYNAWKEGTHGTLSTVGKVKCADCHDPHRPKMTLLPTAVRRPPQEPVIGAPLDCLSCHVKILKGHDKLGSGSEACWACHYNTEMTTLHLAGGETQFPLSDFPRLCAQCHQERYKAWVDGTHGVPALSEREPAIPGTEKAKCINCHEPHRPQIALLNITKSHPAAQPPPSPPSTGLLVMLGISVLLAIAVSIAVVKKGEWP